MRDVDVRCRLRALLNGRFQDDPSTVIVDELGIHQGQVRIDVAAVNGHLYGFEIKAAADTLKRLDAQVHAYSRVLDYAAVVVAEKHLKGAEERLPTWWGIYLAHRVDAELVIDLVREPKPNPAIDPRALAELLWHHEALTMLETRGALRGVRSKPRSFAWDRLCEAYTLDEIREAVRMRLKERQGRKVALPHA